MWESLLYRFGTLFAERLGHHIRHASKIYENAAPGLLEYVFVDAPALLDTDGPERAGHRLILDGDTGQASARISYADLGAVFLEIENRKDGCVGKSVFMSTIGTVREMGYFTVVSTWRFKGRV
jgi:hypothetical protein